MMYKIKTIYIANMLKKNTLKQFVYNSKFKAFKFLSSKLTYQRELKLKSTVFNRLGGEKEDYEKYE